MTEIAVVTPVTEGLVRIQGAGHRGGRGVRVLVSGHARPFGRACLPLVRMSWAGRSEPAEDRAEDHTLLHKSGRLP